MIDKQRHATQTANPIAMVIVEGINLAAVALLAIGAPLAIKIIFGA